MIILLFRKIILLINTALNLVMISTELYTTQYLITLLLLLYCRLPMCCFGTESISTKRILFCRFKAQHYQANNIIHIYIAILLAHSVTTLKKNRWKLAIYALKANPFPKLQIYLPTPLTYIAPLTRGLEIYCSYEHAAGHNNHLLPQIFTVSVSSVR